MRSGFVEWLVMQVNMYCWKACCVVVLSFMRISVVGEHVQWVGMSCWSMHML